jgi:hypothetical protein
MVTEIIQEPELEFGTGNHIDIRFGLMEHGPLDVTEAARPEKVRVAVVGSNQSIEGVSAWIDKCRGEIPAKQSGTPNLFPLFPGFSQQECFRAEVVLDPTLNQQVHPREFVALHTEDYDARTKRACALFLDAIRKAAQKQVDVILCSMPTELIDLITPEDPEKEKAARGQRIKMEFHDLLKAEAMAFGKPLQLVRPTTYGGSVKRKGKHADQPRKLQDEATRAWNFFTALYYKAGGLPWRLIRDDSAYTTCFIGISFYVSPDKSSVNTSVAQVFNERGHGLAVRGSEAVESKEDRQLHLSEAGAEQLVADCLKSYRDEHKTWPARVVVHKTSNFSEEERCGFQAALKKAGVELFDLITISESFIRLFREGYFPPLRGTWLNADEENQVLYTRGSVDFYQQFPGMYVPKSLLIKCADVTETPRKIAEEILALSKTNWNNVQIDALMPITITAARQVASILRWIPQTTPIQQPYRHYM